MCFAYAVGYDLDSEQSEDLWYHISEMDISFLEWWKKKQRKPKIPKGGKHGTDAEGPS